MLFRSVGYDILGEAVIADIAEFPHLLVGGTSGSGKSSALHSLLMSIVYKQPADKVKLLLMDFGASRLRMFKDVPHMLTPGKIISDFREGCQFILNLQKCVEQRQKILEDLDTRDYDKQLETMPSIVCAIDEFPTFIKQETEGRGNKNLKAVIEDVLARARKVKVHLILTAQDTTKGGIDITNTNLAAGIAFQCKNWHTSKAIIGDVDAVNLSGKGSMYFKCEQGLRRLQGAYMPPEKIMDKLDEMSFENDCSKIKYDEVKFQFNTLQQSEDSKTDYECLSIEDEDERILLKIVEGIQDKEKYSNHQLMKSFKMGYDRAKRLIDRLEEMGIVGKLEEKKGRDVYPDKAKAFLRDHGYVESVNEGKGIKSVKTSSIQSDVEVKQEQAIKVDDEEMDTEAYVEDSFHEVPETKKRKLRVGPEIKKNNSTRYRKKGPTH